MCRQRFCEVACSWIVARGPGVDWPLKRFYEGGITMGLPADTFAKLRAMFAVLDRMKSGSELYAWPLWKVHTLTGGRQGVEP